LTFLLQRGDAIYDAESTTIMTYRGYHRHNTGFESVRYRTKIEVRIEENHLWKIMAEERGDGY
jgi:hypothetical protein